MVWLCHLNEIYKGIILPHPTHGPVKAMCSGLQQQKFRGKIDLWDLFLIFQFPLVFFTIGYFKVIGFELHSYFFLEECSS